VGKPQLNIGTWNNAPRTLNGAVDEINFIFGTAKYTEDFDVPTEPFEEIAQDLDPVAIIIADKQTCTKGETVTLSGSSSYCQDGEITSYSWSTGATTDTIEVTPSVSTVYSLTVIATNGNSDITSIEITVEEPPTPDNEIDLMKWLPEYWHPNKEMIEILDRDEEEYTTYKGEQAQVYTDAFIMQASEERISQWEHALELPPSGTLNARRIAVYNKLFSVTKLTEEIIRSYCASIYNGAECTVTLSNSIIHVKVMLAHSQQAIIDLSALADALETKRPLHIGLDMQRDYFTWSGVKTIFTTWTATNAEGTWLQVLLHIED
jgi:hypothetical protein